MAFSISAWRRWSASSSRVFPVPVGDEAVIAVVDEEGQLGTGRGLHPPDDEPHRCGVGLALEGGVGGLGHIGGAVHPVGNGRPVLLRYGLNQLPQAGVLADGDGEADIQLAAGGHHGMDVEAAVGPHRELSPGSGVAHPPHRLPQEVSSAAGGVGASLTQPGHQHVPGAGGHGQQRVVAPLAGVAMVSRTLLGQSVGLADGGVQVDGQRSVAGSGPSRPGPGPSVPGSPGPADGRGPQLKLCRNVPRVDGALTTQPRTRAVPPARNASASSMQSPPARAEATRGQHLVARIGAAWGAAQVKMPVNQLGQSQMQSQGGRQEQPGIGHQAVVIEGDLDAVGVVAW